MREAATHDVRGARTLPRLAIHRPFAQSGEHVFVHTVATALAKIGPQEVQSTVPPLLPVGEVQSAAWISQARP
jgi:hypothetical protein